MRKIVRRGIVPGFLEETARLQRDFHLSKQSKTSFERIDQNYSMCQMQKRELNKKG